MENSEKKLTPQAQYHRRHQLMNVGVHVYDTEKDIADRLSKQPQKATYIKRLIREDIARNPDTTD